MSAVERNSRSKVARNWVLSLASWAVPLGLTFVSTPIVVRRLGTEQYGIYAVVLGYLSAAFSTGVGKLAAKYIPEYRAVNSPDKLSRALSATVLIAVGLGALQAIILAVAAPWIAQDILLLSDATGDQVVVGLRIAAVTGLIMINGQVFQFATQGLHRFDIYSALTIFSGILSSVGNVILVWYGFGLEALLLWNGVVALAIGVLFFILCRPLLPEWRFSIAPGRGVLRLALAYAGSIVAYQALTSILYAFERSLIVRRFGAESVSYYVVPLMLAMYLHAFLASFVQVLFPVVNELLANRERLVEVYLRSTKILVLIVGFLLASYLSLGPSFLGLWLGSEFAARSGPLLWILALSFGLNAVSMVVWLTTEAFRAPAINALSSAVSTVVSVALMLPLGSRYGLEGFAISRLVGILMSVPLIVYIEKRFLGSVFGRFWMQLIFKVSLAAAVTGAFQAYFDQLFGNGWLTLFTAGVLGLIVYVLICVLSGSLNSNEIRSAIGFFPGMDRKGIPTGGRPASTAGDEI